MPTSSWLVAGAECEVAGIKAEGLENAWLPAKIRAVASVRAAASCCSPLVRVLLLFRALGAGRLLFALLVIQHAAQSCSTHAAVVYSTLMEEDDVKTPLVELIEVKRRDFEHFGMADTRVCFSRAPLKAAPGARACCLPTGCVIARCVSGTASAAATSLLVWLY
jgi:hypothetical protein